ncbi:MAG: DegT/DnrJ/EryC1/StrS family aminotransferase, partial [Victivallaceae bacterium]|nr:DegT/DnrJ/EryC1/StrS family aminotransferase [Victivallaceae bacterium]
AFSIMFGKHFCCGGQGGMVFTKDPDIYRAVRNSSDRGKPYDEKSNGNVIAALNFNMDELHAVIGRVQLKKLPIIVEKRRAFVQLLKDKGISEFESIIVPELLTTAKHSYWWWRLGVDSSKLTCSKDEFCASLIAEGMTINPKYTGALPYTFDWFQNHANKHPWNNPLYKGDPAQEPDTPNAFAVMKIYFNLNISESWGEQEANDIITIIKKVESTYLSL